VVQANIAAMEKSASANERLARSIEHTAERGAAATAKGRITDDT
jgi:hypothetical protein